MCASTCNVKHALFLLWCWRDFFVLCRNPSDRVRAALWRETERTYHPFQEFGIKIRGVPMITFSLERCNDPELGRGLSAAVQKLPMNDPG